MTVSRPRPPWKSASMASRPMVARVPDEQFLSSNTNEREDAYGGSPEKLCRFLFELMGEIAKAIGEQNLAIRLSLFDLFNQARGEQSLETWTHLCEGLKKDFPTLSYVSFIELRFKQMIQFE